VRSGRWSTETAAQLSGRGGEGPDGELTNRDLAVTPSRSPNLNARADHAERNHQGLGKVIPFPFPSPDAVSPVGRVERRQRLGGVLSFYERRAA
jgi:hypothetical protein